MRNIVLCICSLLFGVGLFAGENYNDTELVSQLAIADFALKNTEQGTNEGQYSAEIYAELQERNATAVAVQSYPQSQEEIDGQASVMNEIIHEYAGSLVNSYSGEFNIESLTTEITVATWLLSASNIGTKKGQYPKDDYYALYDAKQEAKATLNYAESQSEINEAYQTLVSAIETFKATVIAEDIVLPPSYDNSQLSLAIDNATQLLETTTYGTEIGQYSVTEYMNLADKTNAAKEILAKSTLQVEIDRTEASLNKAIQAYIDTKITEENYVSPESPYNVGQLNSKIATADYYLEHTTYGTNAGQYPIAQYQTLLSETGKAKDILTTAESQAEIDEQTTALDNAITAYVESKLTESLPEQDSFEVTVLANNDEYGTTYGDGTYAKQRSARIIAVPASGYKFVKWEDNNTDNPRDVIVTKDEVFMAVFEKNTEPITDSTLYSIQAVSIDDQLGIVLGSSNNIAFGTKITLIAQASYDGYHFARWSDGNTENPRQLTVSDNMVLIAIFENGSTAVEEIENDYIVSVANSQIAVNGFVPATVTDIQGRTIINKNLKSGIYFITVDGKSFSIFMK